MSDALDIKAILDEHADCDYEKRVPSGLKSLTPEELKQVIETTEGPLVIKFGKDFCGWTKKLNRVLQELAPKYADRATFYELNLPTYPQMYAEWQIETSPMMILLKDGKEIDRSDAAEAWEVPPVFEQWFGPA